MAHKLVLWEPITGCARRGHKIITYVDNIKEDTEVDFINEMMTMMLDIYVWRDKAKKSALHGARGRQK